MGKPRHFTSPSDHDGGGSLFDRMRGAYGALALIIVIAIGGWMVRGYISQKADADQVDRMDVARAAQVGVVDDRVRALESVTAAQGATLDYIASQIYEMRKQQAPAAAFVPPPPSP